MRISVIGCGYLGAVHAACMAQLGHHVVGIDIDKSKVAELSQGQSPFFESGLSELLTEQIQLGRLEFSSDIEAARGCAAHFICVGTPQKPGELAADLRYVYEALESLLGILERGDLVVGKSTVPPGTAENIASILKTAAPNATLAWNPEFLREGHAIADTVTPDRFVYGVAHDRAGNDAVAILDAVYAISLAEGIPRIVTDLATAQLVKVAANSFLATKISFINAIANLCDVTGADVTQLADAIGHDKRIGRDYLDAGVGFGGGCLPKDIRAFMASAAELGVDKEFSFLRDIDAINTSRRSLIVDMCTEELDGKLDGKSITILGASFKPNSDDVRDSPALEVAVRLQDRGAVVTVTDPEALRNAKNSEPTLNYCESLDEAATGADLIVLLTEWQQYRDIDPLHLKGIVVTPRIVDGRNALDRVSWRAAGWTYRSMGRP